MNIRPVTAADHEAWRELFRAYGVFYETTFSDQVLDGVWGWLMDPAHEVHAIVAEREGELVGFAHIRRLWDTFTAGPGWFLDDLYVAPEHRGTGVARALIERGYADAEAAGGGTFRWITAAGNETAQLLYDRIATRADWVVYEKELG
ncbi:MAG TPA: GNAT family N-acetyltransferase [Pseudolysinimonas sp.]|jgi:ribosomal protein S18 acetylase RimI-like enzyme|nr:GNAT family N-acetyltransferase [Pseudolysinimonas sp.]